MDRFEVYNWKDPNNGVKYKNIIKKKRIFKFLTGLNSNLDKIHGRILGTKPLPSLPEVFSNVRQEESRRKLIVKVQTNEYLALAAQGNLSHPNENQREKGRPRCQYCQKLGHRKNGCWGLHRKPPGYKPCGQRDHQSSGNVVATPAKEDSSPFSKEQLDALQNLLLKDYQVLLLRQVQLPRKVTLQMPCSS